MPEVPSEISQFITDCNIDLAQRPIETMQSLYSELLAGNAISNLTRVTDQADFWSRHIADSLLIGRAYPELITGSFRVADVGCGGGFPILPLAWANPNLDITGIEARGKKTTFVANAAQNLGLANVSILNAQAREAGRTEGYANSFDFVLLRAVGTCGKMLKECRGLLKPGAKMISYKAPPSAAEERELTLREAKKFGFEYEESQTYTLPQNAGQRLFVTLTNK